MYNTKKNFIALLIILAFTLVACSNREDTDKSKSDSIKDSNEESGSTRAENDKEIPKDDMDDYELMMSYINQIKEEDTEEKVREIMGEPDYIEGSGISYNYYNFGKYQACFVYASDGMILDIIDKDTGDRTHHIFSSSAK